AGAATLSVLMGGILAVSRLILAMGEARELPAWLGAIHGRFRTPHHAVIAIGAGIGALAALFDLRPLILVANVFALTWFAITNFTALKLPKKKRLVAPIVSWLGLGGCVMLLATLPASALAAAFLTLALLAGGRHLVRPCP